MGWIRDFRQDLAKYSDTGKPSQFRRILTEQGLWATFQYRIERAVLTCRLPGPLRTAARIPLIATRKAVELASGVTLPPTAAVGPGLHLPHGGRVVVHGEAILGQDCCINQGATIGVSGRGERRGVPVLGDRVYVGPNAVVVGPIEVGDDVLVGANSLVNRDVPPSTTVVGVPAVVVSREGSKEYLRQSS